MAWILCAILGVAVVVLALKIYRMRKSLREISQSLSSQIQLDTAQTITVSFKDKYVREIAEKLNKDLRELRKIQRTYMSGDMEIKEAVANISHDLRTPLTAIYGYLDLLEKEEKSEAAERYILRIENRVKAINCLTEELFRYSVIASAEAESPERLNLCGALEESLVSFYALFERNGITPKISLPREPVWRNLDPDALSRIFGNIISNALKYSDGDFTVDMTSDGKITFSNTASNHTAIDVDRLFDRFYTVDPARKSTGLGLAIAKTLTEQMGGTISADYVDSMLSIHLEFIL